MRKQIAELGQDPPPMSDCPADFNDFPDIIHTCFDIFNQLPDEYIPKTEGVPYYSGKNLNILNMLFNLHFIDTPEDQLLVLQVINLLDVYAKKELNRKK